jgi:fluoride ion exporter CrcB/FEX
MTVATLKLWINAEFFAVGVGSFVGVALRVGLVDLINAIGYENSPALSYEYFLTVLGNQSFLLSNILGCMIIAFCTSYTFNINYISVPFFKFLTTGVCGCLTTFSSWIVETSRDAVFRGWFAIIVMITIEFALTWSGLMLGFFLANICQQFERNEVALVRVPSTSLQRSIGDVIVRNSESLSQEFDTNHRFIHKSSSITRENRRSSISYAFSEGDDVFRIFNNPETDLTHRLLDSIYERPNEQIGMSHGVEGGIKERSTDPLFSPSNMTVFGRPKSMEFYFWTILFASLSLFLWTLLIVDATQLSVYRSQETRNFCEAVAFAPMGAWIRWGISRIPEVKALWPHMNPHTLIVNYVAVIIACSLTLYAPNHHYIHAITTGTLVTYLKMIVSHEVLFA